MNNIVIVIPTLNEEENIKILFNKLTATKIAFDFLFVDDNSSDRSQEIIKELENKNQNIHHIFRPKKMGIGSAHKEALTWCYQKNYKIIITMDADGTHDPKYIKFLLDKLKNFDIVVTTRFLGKNLLEGWPLFRVFLTNLRHVTISLLLSLPYDSSGAFRCIDCQKVALADLILAKDKKFLFHSIFD